MRVLVAAASRHGSTTEMAEAIGRTLSAAGLCADVRPIEEVSGLAGYDAAVLGSGIYVGRWLPQASEFVRAHAASLGELPVWMFSSGPLGSPKPMPEGEPEEAAELARSIDAREHRVFSGKLDRSRLGLGEKIITNVVRAPEGDFRPWKEIEEWAKGVAGALAR